MYIPIRIDSSEIRRSLIICSLFLSIKVENNDITPDAAAVIHNKTRIICESSRITRAKADIVKAIDATIRYFFHIFSDIFFLKANPNKNKQNITVIIASIKEMLVLAIEYSFSH